MKVLLLFFLLICTTLAAHKSSPRKTWLTLNATEPLVVARGGFSGLFPESSQNAYDMAQKVSLSDAIMHCDLQLTKDGVGFCQSHINLQNSTNIAAIFPQGQRVYNVNGKDIPGWFGLDYEAADLLGKVQLKQNIYTRLQAFDGARMLMPLNITKSHKSPRIWINVEYNMFFEQKKLHPETFLLRGMGKFRPEYISSPEIAFLKYMRTRIPENRTKLIFKFLEADAIEPTIKANYSSLLRNLSAIKSFASGILVPKEYIWPIDNDRYLQPATTLVPDAHREGLEVYASGFANDNFLSYNYSYDPTREYLQFIDNSQFSVDGVLTDFPSTASESIACLVQNKNSSRILKNLIISHEGASGDYPGSTDLAYQKAIDDGADIIDCSVQMSKDGVAFCLGSADLTGRTTVANIFPGRFRRIPEIQGTIGRFSFDLQWSEIQSLKPQTLMARIPANKNKGKFVNLSEFLELTKSKAVSGVLINIENAAYLALKEGLDIVGSVSAALSNATLDKQSTQKVLIQSDDSSVLLKFKDVPTYQRVLNIKKNVGGVSDQIAEEVKIYADAISVHKDSIVERYSGMRMTSKLTNIIPSMHAANVSVYVGVLRNELPDILHDYFSDPYVELATLVAAGVDGIITEFPSSANAYMRSPCANPDAELAYTILPAEAGALYSLAAQNPKFSPAVASIPPLMSSSDVVDPPLPPVSKSASDDFANCARTATRPDLFYVAIAGYLAYLV